MAAEEIAVELDSPVGGAVRVVWTAEAVGGSRPAAEGPWRAEGALDWERIDALRVVSATLPDRRILALAALRPAGAAGHGDEAIAAALADGDSVDPVPEPLLSVEYDGDGLPRRLGIELRFGGDSVPLRIAADVTDATREDADPAVVHAALELQLEGDRGAGGYEIVTPARVAAR